MTLVIHCFPQRAGVQVGAAGNPEVIGIDDRTGIMVVLEFDSSSWKPFLEAAGRLKGVGIAQANRRLYVPGSDGNGGDV